MVVVLAGNLNSGLGDHPKDKQDKFENINKKYVLLCINIMFYMFTYIMTITFKYTTNNKYQ